jgi:hypothetical protein
MEKRKGRPRDPNRPMKVHQRRATQSSINKDGSVRKARVPFTIPKQREYLEKLAETGLKAHAARHVNVSREMVRYERKQNPAFEELEQEALTYFAEQLEAEAIRRAKDGVEKPVYYKGHVVGHITEFSDRLMEVLLKGRIPETYGDQMKGGGDQFNVSGVLVINQRPSVEDWEQGATQQQLPAPIDGGELIPQPIKDD